MNVIQEVTLHRREHTKTPVSFFHRVGPLFLAMLLCMLVSPQRASAQEIQTQNMVEILKNHPASIRGDNLNVSLLFRAIARQAGIAIYVADNIEDTITLEVDERSLYDIFNLVISAKKLIYYEKNGFLFIQKEEDFKNITGDLATERICTQYGKADEYQEKLLPLLSATGTLTVTDRGNCLVITDFKDSIAKITAMVDELDRPIPQVYIEARIVVLSEIAKRKLGVKWGFSEQIPDDLGNVTVSSDITQTIVGNTANLVVGYVRKNLNISMELQALEEDQLVKILSSPRILVLDGKEAEIKQGKEVAYVTQTSDTINTSFREANLSLKVTPRVLKNRYIILDVAVTNDSISTTNTGGQPTIDTQVISSTLFLENAQTVVIGGILQENEDKTQQRVPFLSRIPLLGNLFKNKDNQDTRSELQVFITPTILTMEKDFNPPSASTAAPAETPKPQTTVADVADDKSPSKEVAPEPSDTVTDQPASKQSEQTHTEQSQPEEIAPVQPDDNETISQPEQLLFAVQVASFRQERNAQKMVDSLRSKGYTPHIKQLTSSSETRWYAVRLGDYPDRPTAIIVAEQYQDREKKDAMVVALQ